ncbi:ATP-binding cassette domain-containing protein [Leucobacter luti]|uniref:ATP-binding cassette domain-containing protein n=1 Tax=Leucobacter luti TaxID=340320 RepID=UPI00215DB3D4|nr:ATP-binding cassette domain-containing protein [Leucobacter luti]
MTAALALDHAAFGYAGVTRVEDLTFQLPTGAALALIGPNGSGKSTLLRGILGLADRTAGSIRVLDMAPDRARRAVGSLPQADTRDTTLPITLRQVVTMGLYRSRGRWARLVVPGEQRWPPHLNG